MAAVSRTRSTGRELQDSGGFGWSDSPSGRLFYSGGGSGCGRYISDKSAFASSSTSAFAASPASAFCSGSTEFFSQRAASPTRIKIVIGSPAGRSLDSIAAKRRPISSAASSRKTCMCSPTTHPGSFRCSLHKGLSSSLRPSGHKSAAPPSNRLNARRSAMTNSLVRIGSVDGEWVKRALAALIRPSSHQQRRREAFHPQPSRLSLMSKAKESPNRGAPISNESDAGWPSCRPISPRKGQVTNTLVIATGLNTCGKAMHTEITMIPY